MVDGFAKSPSAVLSSSFVAAAYLACTLHSSAFASLASGAFCFAIAPLRNCEGIAVNGGRMAPWKRMMEAVCP